LSETPSKLDSENSSSTTQVSKKNTNLWQPGQSGNPLGRPKGSKGRITAQKLAIEEALRDQLNMEMPEILVKAIELAKDGDRAMIKLLVEMTMSKPQATEDADEGKERVKVTIRNLTLEQKKDAPQFIEAKVIKENTNEQE
jgi:hypothetical protein